MKFLPENVRPFYQHKGPRGPRRIYAKVKSFEKLELDGELDGERIAFQGVDAGWFDTEGRNITERNLTNCSGMRVFVIRISLAELRRSAPKDAADQRRLVLLLKTLDSVTSDNDGKWFEFSFKSPMKGSNVVAAARLYEDPNSAGWSMRVIAGSLIEGEKRDQLVKFYLPKSRWRDSKFEFSITGILNDPQSDIHVVAYDVGHGSAAGIHHRDGWVQCYIDLGGGIPPNKATYPTGLRFCFTHKPLIILSHWHQDHWISATFDERALKCDWLVPEQEIGPMDFALLLAIEARGGRVNLWPHNRVVFSGLIYVSLFEEIGFNNIIYYHGIGC